MKISVYSDTKLYYVPLQDPSGEFEIDEVLLKEYEAVEDSYARVQLELQRIYTRNWSKS